MKKNSIPTLLLDKQKAINNIERMAGKAIRNQVELRPHFKTHVSAEVGEWFRQSGVKKITVSSVDMAEYFHCSGWEDITIAFPFNILEMEKVNKISGRCDLHLTLVSESVAGFLSENLSNTVGIFIKIDVGYHRTGLAITEKKEIDAIIQICSINDKMKFMGFLAHAGHTYDVNSIEDIAEIHNSSLETIQYLRDNYSEKYPNLVYSIGDTPSCSTQENFNGVSEIRPGNFVFYDLKQQSIGSCDYSDIAVVMECPVVAKHEERNEIVIYGGGVHFSKDSLEYGDGCIYGRVVKRNELNGWSEPLNDIYVVKLSQEHGIIRTGDDNLFHSINPGDTLLILPVHSCLTSNLMGKYQLLDDSWISRM